MMIPSIPVPVLSDLGMRLYVLYITESHTAPGSFDCFSAVDDVFTFYF